jgi:nicotinamide riboside transporter PnuC
VNSDKSTSRNIAWGAWIVVAVGGALFLLGATRFVHRHRFGFIDALHCCLAVVAAGVLLLVFDYVVHHAKLVAIIPLFAAVVLIFSSPAFDVAVGLALMGAIVIPALSEWKDEKRRRKSASAHDTEDVERK